jgi:hypothetical protein
VGASHHIAWIPDKTPHVVTYRDEFLEEMKSTLADTAWKPKGRPVISATDMTPDHSRRALIYLLTNFGATFGIGYIINSPLGQALIESSDKSHARPRVR